MIKVSYKSLIRIFSVYFWSKLEFFRNFLFLRLFLRFLRSLIPNFLIFCWFKVMFFWNTWKNLNFPENNGFFVDFGNTLLLINKKPRNSESAISKTKKNGNIKNFKTAEFFGKLLVLRRFKKSTTRKLLISVNRMEKNGTVISLDMTWLYII